MRHFNRTSLSPAAVIEAADSFFPVLGLTPAAAGPRMRTWRGVLGTPEVTATVRMHLRPEGGHYTFVEFETDQMGESRVDRNVKRFFVELHRQADPAHRLEAAY